MRLHLGHYSSVQNHLLIAQATIAAFTQVRTTTEMKYRCIVPCTLRINLTLMQAFKYYRNTIVQFTLK